MHRSVQETVRRREGFREKEIGESIIALALEKGRLLSQGGWVDAKNRWETAPLTSLADRWFDQDPETACVTANDAAITWEGLGDYAQAESLLRRSLEVSACMVGTIPTRWRRSAI